MPMNTNGLLTILLFTSLRVLGDSNTSQVRNVHITLGDYFFNEKSPIIYRIGFQVSSPIKDLSIELEYPDTPNKQHFTTKECRFYKVKDRHERVDYQTYFCFVELQFLHNNTKFTYRFLEPNVVKRRSFNFESNIMASSSPVIVSVGDHDVINIGRATIDSFIKFKYDLMVFLGDIAYEVQDQNGRRGDDYFNKMEPVFTKAPIIWTPGNHENFDKSLMFTSRVWMPGTTTPMENNMFIFRINDILFSTPNLDLPTNLFPDKFYTYVQSFRSALNNAINLFKPKFKIFFSHRPFYCAQYLNDGPRCMVSPWDFKPFEDVLNEANNNLCLFGHNHYYERQSFMDGYEIKKEETHGYLIAGTAGNHEIFPEYTPFDIQFRKKQVYKTTGFLVLNPRANDIKVEFVACKNFKVMDSVIYTYERDNITSTQKSSYYVLGIAAVFVSLGIFFLTCSRTKRKQTEKYEPVQN